MHAIRTEDMHKRRQSSCNTTTIHTYPIDQIFITNNNLSGVVEVRMHIQAGRVMHYDTSLQTIDGCVLRSNLAAIDAKSSKLRSEQSSREQIIRAATRSRLESTPQPAPAEESAILGEACDGIAATRASAASYAPVKSPASARTFRSENKEPAPYTAENTWALHVAASERKHVVHFTISGTSTLMSRWVL